MSTRSDPWRAGLEVALLAVIVLALQLMPEPQALVAAMRQAESYRAAQAYGAAAEAYRMAAGLDAGSPRPWQRLGEVFLQQHRFAQAGEAFDLARQNHGGAAALLGLGEARAGDGDWFAAIGAWLQAVALAPEDPRLQVALGRGMIAQGQMETAEQYVRHALELAPPPDVAAQAHALLGRLLAGDVTASKRGQATGHLSQAGDADMLAVLQAVDAEPEPDRQALLLGIAFLQRDELVLARRQLERAVALAPAGRSAEAHAYLGHILDRLGETVMARQALEEALALDPSLVLPYYFLGLHERQIGDTRKAQATLWQGLLLDPQNAALRLQMAETMLDLRDYEGAAEWYQGAVDVAPQDQQVEFYLALIHFHLDHLYRVSEKGLPAAEAAAALAPDDARVQDLLGWAYHLDDRHGEAEQALLRALEIDPELVSAHFHLGSLYARLGRHDLARRHLQRAADLDIGGYYRERAEAVLKDLK